MGKLTVFRGPSGSGKTTLLSLIGGMSRPTTGRIWIGEDEISTLPEKFLCRMRRRRFGFMFQNFQLIRGLSLLENIRIPMLPLERNDAGDHDRARALLDELGLTDRCGEPIENLSGGEQQRVSLARALINDPDILIADEPTAHLDTDLSRKLLAIMERICLQGRTILMASHDPLVVHSKLVDRVVELRDGLIVGQGGAP
jgi:putative ABC transport system ATP-binding protein